MTWKDASRPQTASSEDVREINRRIVLNLIRTRQPVSRADLARLSGMQLIRERWVLEGATGRLPRGRRPTFLLLNNDRVIIAVDVRPTQTTVAVADVNGEFTTQQMMETPSDAGRATRAIVRQVKALARGCHGKKIEGIGVTLPGRYDPRRGALAFAPTRPVSRSRPRTPRMPASWRRFGSGRPKERATWWPSPSPRGLAPACWSTGS
jgi:hypothetical protein